MLIFLFFTEDPSVSLHCLSLYWSLLRDPAISSLTLGLKQFLQQLLLCTEKNILQSKKVQHKGRATEHVQQYVPLPPEGHIRLRETLKSRAPATNIILICCRMELTGCFCLPLPMGLRF